MAKVRRGSSEGPPAACSGPGNRVQLGKPGLPTSPRGLRPSKQPKRRTGSSAKLGTPTPLALAGRQGELTDAACELGPQASHPLPPPWARECPCRLGPCRVPGASSSGARSHPRQKAAVSGWDTTLPSTHPGDGSGEAQRLQVLFKFIQGHWGHLPTFRSLRRGCTRQQGCLPSSRLCGFAFAQAPASVLP